MWPYFAKFIVQGRAISKASRFNQYIQRLLFPETQASTVLTYVLHKAGRTGQRAGLGKRTRLLIGRITFFSPFAWEHPQQQERKMAGLNLKAQGTHITSDDRLIFAVEVLNDAGEPVLGLKKSNFKIWQFGHLFGELPVDIVVPLDEIDALKGYYHLVRKNWSPAVNGTFAFRVSAGKGRSHGQVMTWVVKVDGGPK